MTKSACSYARKPSKEFVQRSKAKGENVGGAIKWVTSQKTAVVHLTTSAESAATWVILKCVVTPSRIKDETPAAVQVVVGEPHEQNPVVDEEEKIQRNNVMHTT